MYASALTMSRLELVLITAGSQNAHRTPLHALGYPTKLVENLHGCPSAPSQYRNCDMFTLFGTSQC